MATTLLDRVPLERISAEAHQIHVGRVLLTLLVGVLYALGWIAGKTFTVAALGLGWTLAAVKVGWTEARRTSGWEHDRTAGRARGGAAGGG